MGWLGKLMGASPGQDARRSGMVPDGAVVFAVGDIHGRFDLLQKLMTKLSGEVRQNQYEDVHLIFLGDYIDRGFDSKSVLDYLARMEWGRVKPVFLLGNHEQTMLDFLERPDVGARWIEYGGRGTLISYGVQVPENRADMAAWEAASAALKKAMPKSHVDFLKGLQSFHEFGNCYFVHAGIDPARSLSEQTDEDRLWIRDKFLSSSKKFEKVIVHGHTPEEQPTWNGRRIGVDTGAYITNTLTAVRICGSEVDFITT